MKEYAPLALPRAQCHGWRLFSLSFTALFLELIVIRWVPSEVRLVAYYANLMLVSSFLGLGVGAMIGSRRWQLFHFFAPALTVNILLLLCLRYMSLPSGSGEWRFQIVADRGYAYLTLAFLFICNAALFVPLGEEIGGQFQRMPALRAYMWDLGGSLTGTLCFGVFSLLKFSPLVGIVLVAGLALMMSGPRQRLRSLPWYVATLGAMIISARHNTFWSPYYFISLNEQQIKPDTSIAGPFHFGTVIELPAKEPPLNVRTMADPPIYVVRVNQDFYQVHGTIDMRRYHPGSWQRQHIAELYAQYSLPYQLLDKVGDVLVLGAGGGMDIETALLNGARHVDAVEIDPVIPRLSNRLNGAAPYADKRVVLHIDDARAFLERCSDQYDLVTFGFLDSQALFSYGASLRLDGYTYTIEGFRRAFERVREGGAMSVAFFVGREWLAQKLVQMVAQSTGSSPSVYVLGAKVTIVAPKGRLAHMPETISGWTLVKAASAPVALATDDWPYLYLEKRGIPGDYLVVIGVLLVVSVAAVASLRGSSVGLNDGHFFFLGWGFLLLQTKSIGDCSLYFGTTWFVTTIVISGILLMVLLANWAARYVGSFNPWLYAPLFASLAVLLLVPREAILGLDLAARLAWALLAVPLPVFFAGVIFSTTFRAAGDPSKLFGANLVGATIGGFCEYLGMAFGSRILAYVVIVAYAGSVVCLLQQRRVTSRAAAMNT